MPTFTHLATEAQLLSSSEPFTPAQKFFWRYRDTVDKGGFNHGSGREFYSADVTYHNSNGAIYHGADEMWAWMKDLFRPFERLKHDIRYYLEIADDDDDGEKNSCTMVTHFTRNIWMKGNTGEKPDVSVPVSWTCRIGPGDSPEAFNGLQMKEVWLFWDSALLMPFMGKSAVAFRTINPYEGVGKMREGEEEEGKEKEEEAVAE